MSKVRRTVWDGAQELWEVQMPGEAGNTDLENDGEAQIRWAGSRTDAPSPPGNSAPSGGVRLGNDDRDQNTMYGRVAYTFGTDLDKPLSVVRFGYTDVSTFPSRQATPYEYPAVNQPARRWAPFAIFPLWDVQGSPELGVFADGRVRPCEPDGSRFRCVRITWPRLQFGNVRDFGAEQAWHGSLLRDKQDATGLLYRRNRVYDPRTGRFTQEDPIGLAGGLNLYGFAEGDPVNYADPFGLCPNPTASGLGSLQCAIEDVIGAIKAGPGLLWDAISTPSPQRDLAIGLAQVPLTFAGGIEARGARAAGSAAARALELNNALPPGTRGRVTTAVVETVEGVRVVSSSEGRLRPAQRALLEAGEIHGVGQRGVHAEVNAVNAARGRGLTPAAVAPSRPACPACRRTMGEQGIPITGP